MKKYFTRSLFLALAAMVFLAPAAIAGHHGSQCSLKAKGECSKGGSCCSKDEKGGCPIVGKTLCMAHSALEHQKELSLSDDQVKAIRALKLEVKKQKIQQSAQMQIGMLEMHAMLKADTLDVEGLKAMIDQGMAAMATSAKASIDQYAQMRSILKQDQIAKLKELCKK
jgi:Spy/CpxP family protein refolding chaperone